MTHQLDLDLTSRSTPALIEKLRVAQQNDELEMEDLVRQELDRRGEHPDGVQSDDD